MKKTFLEKRFWTKKLSLSLCIVLTAATALFATGCNDNSDKETQQKQQEEQSGEKDTDVQVIGEGQTRFAFTVVDGEGKEAFFEVNTDETTVGAALLDCGLIEGDEGEFGLYVTKVNGIEADYEADGTYWAFYVNDEYASAGVDMTDIAEGDTYMFKVEK